MLLAKIWFKKWLKRLVYFLVHMNPIGNMIYLIPLTLRMLLSSVLVEMVRVCLFYPKVGAKQCVVLLAFLIHKVNVYTRFIKPVRLKKAKKPLIF